MSAIPLSLSGEIPELLRRFACTEALSIDDLVVLASRCSVLDLPAGERLFTDGDLDRRVTLLLSGALELTAPDGSSRRLLAGTPAAGQPVESWRPGAAGAPHAATAVTLLRFDDSDLGDWLTSPPTVPGSDDSVAAAGLGVPHEWFPANALDFGAPDPLNGHRLRILSGELALPSLPDIALDACRAIDRDDADAATLARVLLNDPAITGKLLRTANSPLFYGRVAVDRCERAVLRLGLRATRQLVIAFALRDVFRSDQPGLQQIAEMLWDHSTAVAALSFVLARRLDGFDAGEAQLAGLLHAIGAVPVLGYAAGEPSLRHNPRDVQSLVATLRVPLGRQLLESWGFEESMVAVAGHAEDWRRPGDGPADLADLVLVAQYLSLHHADPTHPLPPLERLPAFWRLCNGRMSVVEAMNLVAEADEQVREVRSLLQG